jgi:hypothetical protein
VVEAGEHGGVLAEVTGEMDEDHGVGERLEELLARLLRVVGRAVVDEDDLVRQAGIAGLDAANHVSDGAAGVEDGNDEREFGLGHRLAAVCGQRRHPRTVAAADSTLRGRTRVNVASGPGHDPSAERTDLLHGNRCRGDLSTRIHGPAPRAWDGQPVSRTADGRCVR